MERIATGSSPVDWQSNKQHHDNSRKRAGQRHEGAYHNKTARAALTSAIDRVVGRRFGILLDLPAHKKGSESRERQAQQHNQQDHHPINGEHDASLRP